MATNADATGPDPGADPTGVPGPRSPRSESTHSAGRASPRSAGDRLLAIDGLRGGACLGVAVYHLTRYGETAALARTGISDGWLWIADHGWIGVQIFFVISGFVIAHTLREAVVDGWYVANYALRRSLRLDPPYWATIALVLAIHAWFSRGLGWESPLDVPTPLDPPLSWWLVVSHVLYIHKLQGFDSLSTGFWTLCIEIQFYLLYVCSLGLAQWVAGRPPAAVGRQTTLPEAASARRRSHGVLLGLLLPLAPLSLWWLSPRPRGDDLVFHHFFLFFSGCLAGWSFNRLVSRWWLWGWQALLALTLVSEATRGDPTVGLDRWFSNHCLKLWAAMLTTLFIDWAGHTGRLARPLPLPGLNAAGRISYSLYLVHFPVAFLLTSVCEHSLWRPRSAAGAQWVLALSLLAGIAVAWVMYRAIEAPSQQLAQWLKLRPREIHSAPRISPGAGTS